MKEGNEPTRRRVLICICLKWQVREQEEGCSFLPFRRRRVQSYKVPSSSPSPWAHSCLLPAPRATSIHDRRNVAKGKLQAGPEKGTVKTQEKHKSSACHVLSPSRQLGFNSSPGERMGRARGGQSHRTVSGCRTVSTRTRLGLMEHHQRSAPNWCVWSTALIPGKKENHASHFSQVPPMSKLPTKPLGAGKKASSQLQHLSVSRRGGPNLNRDLNRASQASEEVKPRTEGKISEKRSPTFQ